ncbi:hypothetical protein [Pontibacter amylolyticus]|uniref:Uncharacterized protein n=1 Tax=Pontibacter amylolyticus TaxID=1424080 RepID=A0ABQ1W970_9BACT|nr:hypothetical protein [Pontibacter amylolyticus]GGG19765.1 hypothetical protein GCM10011323_24840 [Pontibacter amylolyticus]
MPDRLSLKAHHLHNFDVVYLGANGNEVEEEKKLDEKVTSFGRAARMMSTSALTRF